MDRMRCGIFLKKAGLTGNALDIQKQVNMHRIVKRSTGLFKIALVLQCLVSPCYPQANKVIPRIKPDSARVHISEKYDQPGFLQQLFMGKNYRKEWSTPVMLPVLDLKALQVRIEEVGGGKQTKSLRMIDKDSVEWVLRMIDKKVDKALPPLIRNPLTVSIVQDMVSAAHPYAPLTIPPLARATGVSGASPRFYFVPEDTLLGKYKDLFANTVCLLERREVSAKYTETENSKKVIEQLLHSNQYSVNQQEFLKARLLDMVIGDWDRHYDQWRWAEKQSGDRKTYLPLPKDRDQAYFYSKGWLVRFVRFLGLRPMAGFTKNTSNIIDVNSVAWTLDRILLNQLTATEWKRIAEKFQRDLTDDVIIQAIRKLPPEIYALNGATLTRKLMNRKKTLGKDVMGYYRFLSWSVTVLGTDEAEHFHFTGNKDSLTLTVTDSRNRKHYQRTFYPEETHEIRLLGLDGDDVFTGSSETKIHIRINGGKGKNQYDTGKLKKVKIRDTEMDAACYEEVVRKQLRITE